VNEPAADRSAEAQRQKPIDALPIILRAMERINQDDDWYALGSLGSRIMADAPDFDTRSYGKQKLSDLIADLKRFETRKEGNQLMVRRRD
jgi:hypothetical protein